MRVLCIKGIYYGWKSWELFQGHWYDTDGKIHDPHISYGGTIRIISGEFPDDYYAITNDVFQESFIGEDQAREDKLNEILS